MTKSPSSIPAHEDAERVRAERDLYLGLLRLGTAEHPSPFLSAALELVVRITNADQGYVELAAVEPGASEWSISAGFEEVELANVRANLSSGIVAEALAEGQTILTPSALLDPRFGARESVRASAIQAVICAPIGGSNALGVVYLQSHGETAPFSTRDRELVELFGELIAPSAHRIARAETELTADGGVAALKASLGCTDFLGQSPAFADALRQASVVAPLEVDVLLTGDSGTGKTRMAEILHRNSKRARGPFVELNCAALPESLVENELFGSAAGAHSTATKATEGKVGAADGGTLFLDEVGELPLSAQGKFLQFLQSKTFYALGSTTQRTADVRVIAGTNVDLKVAVREKRFREDLYYRLDVVPLHLPELAKRRGDLDELVDRFVCRAIEAHDLPPLDISFAARTAIKAAEWPGNIRQLEHAVEAAAIRASTSSAQMIQRVHVFPGEFSGASDQSTVSFQEATRLFQADLLRNALHETGWNISECARRLDLARSHIYNLIQAFGIERDESAD